MTPSGINGIHHVGLSVPDLDRARDFYVGLLGFEEVNRVEWGGSEEVDRIMRLAGSSGRLMVLRSVNAFLEIFEFATPAPAPRKDERPVHHHGFSHLCLDVGDVDGLHARLTAAGMAFHCTPIGTAGVKAVYGRDPFGNVIELQEIVDETMMKRLPRLA